MFNTSTRDFHKTKFLHFLNRNIKAKNICVTKVGNNNKQINFLQCVVKKKKLS